MALEVFSVYWYPQMAGDNLSQSKEEIEWKSDFGFHKNQSDKLVETTHFLKMIGIM